MEFDIAINALLWAAAGDVGFADFRREMTPSFGEAPEAGWVLAAWAHGKGFAPEALRAALAWSDAHLERAGHAACMTTPENAASIVVARRCDYLENGRATYKGHEAVLFQRAAQRGGSPATNEAPVSSDPR